MFHRHFYPWGENIFFRSYGFQAVANRIMCVGKYVQQHLFQLNRAAHDLAVAGVADIDFNFYAVGMQLRLDHFNGR